MILATSAVHSWLTRKGLADVLLDQRTRSAECVDPTLFRRSDRFCGATTVNAYLAQDSVADRIERGLIEGTLTDAMRRYRDAIDAGLLKIMSKMGISVISSYRGGLNFEAVGLSRAMVAEYFPGMQSRISGIGVSRYSAEESKSSRPRFAPWGKMFLPIGGFYKARRSGEKHAWEAQDDAYVASGLRSGQLLICGRQYTKPLYVHNPPIHMRDLAGDQTFGASRRD